MSFFHPKKVLRTKITRKGSIHEAKIPWHWYQLLPPDKNNHSERTYNNDKEFSPNFNTRKDNEQSHHNQSKNKEHNRQKCLPENDLSPNCNHRNRPHCQHSQDNPTYNHAIVPHDSFFQCVANHYILAALVRFNLTLIIACRKVSYTYRILVQIFHPDKYDTSENVPQKYCWRIIQKYFECIWCSLKE